MHMELLLDSGYNYLNKNVPREQCNFIHSKIGEMISNLPMPARMWWRPMDTGPETQTVQLSLRFN